MWQSVRDPTINQHSTTAYTSLAWHHAA